MLSGEKCIVSSPGSVAGDAACCSGVIEDKDRSGTGNAAETGVVDGGNVSGGTVEVEEGIRCAYRNGHVFEFIL
jgi:hypothetical protein